MEGFERLKTLLLEVGKKEWNGFLMKIAQIALQESHKIWNARNWTDQPK